MKWGDLLLLLLGMVLLAAMVLTILLGGEQSRHGVGRLLVDPSSYAGRSQLNAAE